MIKSVFTTFVISIFLFFSTYGEKTCTDIWTIENNIVTANSVTIEVTSEAKSGFCELVSGWESRRYQKKEPIPVLKVRFPAGAQEIRTRISLK